MIISKGFLTAMMLGTAKQARALALAIQNRRAAGDLLNWDERSLRDIGLTRSDVRAAMESSLVSDPTAILSQIAAGRTPSARQDSASRTARPSGFNAAGRSRPGTLPSAGPAVCA